MATIKFVACILYTLIVITRSQPRIEVSDWQIQSYTIPEKLGPAEAATAIAADGNIYYFGGMFVDIVDPDPTNPIKEFIPIPTYGK